MYLAIRIRDVDRNLLRRIRLGHDGGEIGDDRRTAVQHYGGGNELAREDIPCSHVKAVRVHLHDESVVLRRNRTAVRVHPERQRGGSSPGRHAQRVEPGGVARLCGIGQPHVVAGVEVWVALHRHLHRDRKGTGARPRLGKRHIHPYGIGLVLGHGRHRFLGLAVYRHGHAGRQRLANQDGAGDEVGDETTRGVVDVRGRRRKEHLRRRVRLACRLDGERHTRIGGVDRDLAHDPRHARSIVLKYIRNRIFENPPALHDLGDVRIVCPDVKLHGLDGRAVNRVNRNREAAGIRRGRPLRDRPPDSCRFIEPICCIVFYTEIDRLRINARPRQVDVNGFVATGLDELMP